MFSMSLFPDEIFLLHLQSASTRSSSTLQAASSDLTFQVDPVTLQADSAGDMAEPSDDREEAGDSEKNKTEEQFDELSQLANNQSGGSTPPPESPADDLSARYRMKYNTYYTILTYYKYLHRIWA